MPGPREPDGTSLLLGTATAAFQVEGATGADGRGPSIWDTFCRRPGAIKDGSDGRTACGSYERLDEDLDLVRDLGVAAYRFSVAWPRVQPAGRGPVNAAGLDFYERVVDGLLERGLLPLPTLYHWDLPQPLEDAGGWPARETAGRLADYAGLVAERLGDRVRWWSTLNEPWCSAFLGYAAGVHAPGRTEGAFAAAHHLLLGHALAADAVRAAVPAAQVGIVLNLAPVSAEGPGAADGAAYVDAVQNGLWLGALVEGSYPEVLTALHDPALVRGGDLDAIADSAAWIGINYYTPLRIGSAGAGGSERVQSPRAYPGAPPLRFLPREPTTAMGWEVHAPGLEEVLLTTARAAPGVPLLVTENGSAYADLARAADGSVHDEDRIAYLRDHLAATRRARDAGVDVRAYLAWTLLDNFEWAEGYTKKFGLVEVEPGTLRRIPKASYRYYAELAVSP